MGRKMGAVYEKILDRKIEVKNSKLENGCSGSSWKNSRLENWWEKFQDGKSVQKTRSRNKF